MSCVALTTIASSAYADAAPVAAATGSPAATGTATRLPTPVAAASPAAPSAAVSVHPQGIAVIAFPGATDATWPLAQAVYADRALRAIDVDESQARILCGEPAAANAVPPLRDLAETVAALHGDDAPTRLLLAELARRFSVRALVSVWTDGAGHPTAHVFLPEAGAFDAATYAPDEAPTLSWSGATRSLDRVFGVAPGGGVPPGLATHEAPTQERGASASHFYESPWFWGGIGAAAAAAAAIYLSTRDSSSPTIHLEVQVPH